MSKKELEEVAGFVIRNGLLVPKSTVQEQIAQREPEIKKVAAAPEVVASNVAVPTEVPRPVEKSVKKDFYTKAEFIRLVEYKADREIFECIRRIEDEISMSEDTVANIVSIQVDRYSDEVLAKNWGSLQIRDEVFAQNYKIMSQQEKDQQLAWLKELLISKSKDAQRRGLEKRQVRQQRKEANKKKTFNDRLKDLGINSPSSDREVLAAQVQEGFWLVDELCVLRSYFLYEITQKIKLWRLRSQAPQKWDNLTPTAKEMERSVAVLYAFALEIGMAKIPFVADPEVIDLHLFDMEEMYGLNGILHKEAEASNSIVRQKMRSEEREFAFSDFLKFFENGDSKVERIKSEARSSVGHLLAEYKKIATVARKAKGTKMADGTEVTMRQVLERMSEFPVHFKI